MGRQTPKYVFQDDRARSARQPPQGPALASRMAKTFLTESARCLARDRDRDSFQRAKGLGREMTPMRGRLSVVGKSESVRLATSPVLDVADAPIRYVGPNLLLVEIVGEQAAPQRRRAPRAPCRRRRKTRQNVCLVMPVTNSRRCKLSSTSRARNTSLLAIRTSSVDGCKNHVGKSRDRRQANRRKEGSLSVLIACQRPIAIGGRPALDRGAACCVYGRA